MVYWQNLIHLYLELYFNIYKISENKHLYKRSIKQRKHSGEREFLNFILSKTLNTENKTYQIPLSKLIANINDFKPWLNPWLWHTHIHNFNCISLLLCIRSMSVPTLQGCNDLTWELDKSTYYRQRTIFNFCH